VKALEVFAVTETAYKLAKECRVKSAWALISRAMRGLPTGRGNILP
jgi:hypothetical protein